MTATSGPPRPLRGRPSKQEAELLRKRVVTTALDCFLQNGYAGTSIDAVARRAGVSRTTVYALYVDKASLFSGMIRATVRLTDLTRYVQFDDRDPAVILREAMIAINRVYYHAPNMEILRLCIAEAGRFPELIEGVRVILGSALERLTIYLARLRDAGRLDVAEPARAALIFNLLALGTLKPFLVDQRVLTEEDMTGHIDQALHIFLRGCLARDDAEHARRA